MTTKTLPLMTAFNVLDAATKVVDRDAPLAHVMALLRIAAAGPEGIPMADLQRELQASNTMMTRVTQILGDVHYTKTRPGLGYVEKLIDPMHQSHRLLRITPKGAQAAARIASAVERQGRRK